MYTRSCSPWLLAIALTGAVALPANAGDIHRAVDAEGAILFSDMPPPSEAPSLLQGAVARANEQVDLAEHAFALARQGLSSPRDGLRLATARMTRSDEERVAFYKKDLQVARQRLTDLLRERQAPVQLAAS